MYACDWLLSTVPKALVAFYSKCMKICNWIACTLAHTEYGSPKCMISQMYDNERDYIGIGPKVCYSSKGMNYFRKYVLLHTKLIVIKDSKKTQGYYLDRLNWKTYARTTECCCARTFVHRTHQLVQCMQWSLSCWPSAVSECVWLPLQCCTEYLAAVLRCCETVVMGGAQWLDSLVHHSLCTEPWKLLIGHSTPHTASLNQMLCLP